jgi:hypothetical protein
MKNINVEYLDIYGNVHEEEFLAERFYIDSQGALLIIDADDKVTSAYAATIWRIVSS